jgi:predicted nucleotidyltransferase
LASAGRPAHSTVSPDEARARLPISDAELAAIARRFHIRELGLTGAILEPSFSDDDDIDLVVSFEPGARLPDWGVGALHHSLSEAAGRTVFPLDVEVLWKPGSHHRRLADEMLPIHA